MKPTIRQVFFSLYKISVYLSKYYLNELLQFPHAYIHMDKKINTNVEYSKYYILNF